MLIPIKNLRSALMLLSSCVFSTTVMAAGEVRTVGTNEVPATPFRYTADGNTHTWGVGNNQLVTFITTDNDTLRYAAVADRVELRRDDISDLSTGLPCGVFAERAGPNASMLAADFPNDQSGSGNCDMARMLASRVVNRGTLDLFSNTAPTPKNVERVDYLFDRGLFASFSADSLSKTCHLVAEKRGNNRIQVAAILSLDAFGQPASFGPLVRVHEFFHGDAEAVRYGVTDLHHNYSFFQSNSVTPQAFPVYLQDSTESVAMAMVSAADLHLKHAELYYGFSFFGDDVDAHIHDLLDPSTYPNDTADNHIVPGDGADIYGGVSGQYVSDSISVATGSVFKDENGNSVQDENEAGISDITITLYQDTDGDGVLNPDVDSVLGVPFSSGVSGEFVLPGLPNGQYILVLDNDDPDLPAGTHVPTAGNPLPFSVNNNDPDNLNFAVVNLSGGGGSDAGSADSGTADSGTADSGSTDSGTPGGPDSPNDPGTTLANPDFVRVEQGESAEIDVLANDTDGAGSGLTLVSAI